ncbi:MAG: Fic family protein [Acidobacteriota bacterium]
MSDLISVEAYKEAALNLVVPSDWQNQLDKLNRVRAVHGTTALEGNPLSEAEVSQQMDLLEASITPAKITKEQLQIRNSAIAQDWVKLRFRPQNPPLQISDVLGVHSKVTTQSDETHNIPGKFRTFPVTVGTPEMGGVHRGAPHEHVTKLMNDYVDFVNSGKLQDQHPVIRALLAHFVLVTIHPFGDGNGRVSRLVEAGILFQGGYNVLGFYGLSNYFYRNEAEYKKSLQKCRGRQPFDVTPFVTFGLRGFASELKGINTFIKTKLNRVIYRAMLVRAFNKRLGERRRLLNQREFSLLEFLLHETEPTDPFSENPSRKIKFTELQEVPFIRAAYRDVTARTFYRELVRLGELGFIKFKKDETPENLLIVELDFGAIGKY